MGSSNKSKLTDRKLENYEAKTFFTKSEIKHLYERYESLGGSEIRPVNTDKLIEIPELKNNPFRFRICQVFGTKLKPEDAARIIGTYQKGPNVKAQLQIVYDGTLPAAESHKMKVDITKAAVDDSRLFEQQIDVKVDEVKGGSDVEIHYKNLTAVNGNTLVSAGADSLVNIIQGKVKGEVVVISSHKKVLGGKENENDGDEFDEERSDYWITFDNFVSMMNTFSPRASIQVKAYYAFQLYDYDGDKFINTDDIVKTLEDSIGRHRMSYEKMHQVATGVLAEADLDGNKKLSRTEFNRIIKRMPDFTSKFQFSIQRD